MSDVTAPWEWECGCGIRNNSDHAFCWGCGKPAHAGRRRSTSEAVGYGPVATGAPHFLGAGVDTEPETHPDLRPPLAAPPTATFSTPFRVVDERGRPVMIVDSGPTGARLQLCNAAGKPVVTIGVATAGGAVSISNAQGQTVAVLTATEDGGAFGINGRSGSARVVLANDSRGGFVGVSSADGQRAAHLRNSATGGELVLYDQHGHPLPPRSG